MSQRPASNSSSDSMLLPKEYWRGFLYFWAYSKSKYIMERNEGRYYPEPIHSDAWIRADESLRLKYRLLEAELQWDLTARKVKQKKVEQKKVEHKEDAFTEFFASIVYGNLHWDGCKSSQPRGESDEDFEARIRAEARKHWSTLPANDSTRAMCIHAAKDMGTKMPLYPQDASFDLASELDHRDGLRLYN